MAAADPDRVAYFTRDADGVFRGNDPARGPWSEDHCHAGPVTGLVARAAEALAGPEKMLTRLTVDFLRPLPVAGLRVEGTLTRSTRTLATTRVEVHDPDGGLCAQATTMHLVRKALSGVPTTPAAPPDFAGAVPGPFSIAEGRHDRPMFADFTEIRFPPGEDSRPGPTTLWMRTPRIVQGEDPSPIQALCPLADCGNAISRNAELSEMGFMNTDLTLQVHRAPEGRWFASQSVSYWEPTGIGMSHSVLFDRKGPVGVALQTLVLHPVAQG